MLSVVLHTGETPFSGHYVTSVYDMVHKGWKQYDDSVVRDQTSEQVSFLLLLLLLLFCLMVLTRIFGLFAGGNKVHETSSKSYLLFYAHKSIWEKVRHGETGE
jgi:Ubiquitin carboxyl-terminal hydrolase